jgi:hypothetical protein
MLVLAWQGRHRHGSSAALINAPSHWVHGDKALRANAPSLKFTLLGAAIHHASALFWATLYEGILRALPVTSGQGDQTRQSLPAGQDTRARTPSKTSLITAASALTTAAWLVDTRLVPSRLTPGFERRSSRTGLAVTYGAFAAGLAMGALAARRRAQQGAAQQAQRTPQPHAEPPTEPA